MNCSRGTVKNFFVDSAGYRADQTTHELHQATDGSLSLQTDLVPCQRNQSSNFQHTKPMTLQQVRNSAQWHAWHDQRRSTLQWRLSQAQSAEWNWPSTRARCEVMRIEEELRDLDEQEFVVPNFAEDLEKKLRVC